LAGLGGAAVHYWKPIAAHYGLDIEVVNPEFDPRYREYWEEYYRLTERRGVSQHYAKIEMRRRLTLIGAMLVHRGEADEAQGIHVQMKTPQRRPVLRPDGGRKRTR